MPPDNEPEAKANAKDSRPFLVRHGQKMAALLFWLILLGGYQIYAWRAGLTPLGAVRELAAFLSENPLGWLVFIVVYAARPLILFPATLLTIAAGFVFGAVLGVALTIVGANASAMVAYLVGRYFGGDVLEEGDGNEGFLARYTKPLRENSFETVLIMRFIFLPYDLVNYAAGFLKIRAAPFILATFLGSLPATLSFVLFGASIGVEALSGTPELDWRILGASAALFVASLALSQFFKRRRRRIDTKTPDKEA
ncbi:MAG: TVP38/TMEM64 family protein [Rubrobacter sp.]|nr:TVP38/TMEM64 family protein [Rubrobacter sp.]